MNSPLYHACRNGDTERVRQLLDEGAPVDKKNRHGKTALMVASLLGRTEVVQLLLGKGAAVDEKNKHGRTALMYASEGGRTEVVKLLLGKGAAVDAKDKNGRTALRWASGRTEVAKLLATEAPTRAHPDSSARPPNSVALEMASIRVDTAATKARTDEGTNGRRNKRTKERGSIAWCCWVVIIVISSCCIPVLLLGGFGAMLHMGLLIRRGEHLIEETCTVPAQVPPPAGLPPSPSAIKWQCERHERKSGNDKSGRRLVVYIPTFTGVLMSNELECILYQGKASDSEEGCNQTAADLIGTTSTCYLEQEGSTTCYATKADSVPVTGGYIPDTEYEGDARKERRDRVGLTQGLIHWGITGVTLFGLCTCCVSPMCIASGLSK